MEISETGRLEEVQKLHPQGRSNRSRRYFHPSHVLQSPGDHQQKNLGSLSTSVGKKDTSTDEQQRLELV